MRVTELCIKLSFNCKVMNSSTDTNVAVGVPIKITAITILLTITAIMFHTDPLFATRFSDGSIST